MLAAAGAGGGGFALALRRLRTPQMLPAGVAVAAVLGAAMVGAQVALGVPDGIGLLVAFCFVAVVLVDLPLGIGLWVVLVFTSGVPGFYGAERVALSVGVLAWLLTTRARRPVSSPVLRRHRALLLTVVGFALFIGLSAAWADDLARVWDDLQRWWLAILMFFVVVTAVTSRRHVSIVCACFVLGAVTSVGIGLVSNDLTNSQSHVERASLRDARLHGAEGDPNLLAAGLVPAMFLAGGLMAGARGPARRGALVLAIGFLAVGLVATQSRGGLIAAGVGAMAALAMMRGRRGTVLAMLVIVLGAGGVAAAASPAALDRFTQEDIAEGSGRADLWRVAERMALDHPLHGVGLNNFVTHAPSYSREVGRLQSADLIAETPVVVHNAFLQVLTETGAIGLLLFLAAVVGCLGALVRARARFDAGGEGSLATLSGAVFAATIGMLTASVFLSNGLDKRLWLLLALGPVLLGLAVRLAEERARQADGALAGGPRHV